MILTEKQLRRVIREEFERFMSPPEAPENIISMKSAAGGELILPNPVREKFDEGTVTSLKDIL